MSFKSFDVIVIGAGPAGSVAAICAQRAGAKVALLERSDFSVPRPGEHLSPDVVQKIRELDLWSPHEGQYAECCAIQSAWGSDELIDKSFMMGPYGYARNIDRCRFDQINFSMALEEGVFAVSKFDASIQRRGGDWRFDGNSASGNLKLVTPIVVDATGRSAVMARHVGATDRRFDQLIGIQAVLKINREHSGESQANSSLMIESVQDGWWYALRISDSTLIVTFLTDADLFSAEQSSAANYWARQQKSTKHIRELVQGFVEVESTRIVPAFTRRLAPCQSENYIAIGDAAMSFDPLSSQGISKAIETAIVAERTIRTGCLAATTYSKFLDQSFEDYQLNHNQFYALENRWRESLFWKRRFDSIKPMLAKQLQV